MAYTLTNIDYDFALADQPFLTAASDERPIERALAEIQKQQIDQSDNPGEQSLSGWWVRAQSDWSGGSGSEYMEPASDETIMRSSWTSIGVNPWNQGKLSLLRSHAEQGSLTAVDKSTLVFGAGGSPKYTSDSLTGYVIGLGTLGAMGGYRVAPASDRLSVTTTALTGLGSTISSRPMAVVGGGYVWVVSDDLTSCYSVAFGGTAFAANITSMSTSPKGVWFAKSRIILADGADLYALGASTGSGGSVTIGSLSSSKITPATAPDLSMKWVGAVDAPDAILLAGNSDSAGGTIQRVTVTDAGGITALTGLTTVAELPAGEEFIGISSYLGTYLVMITTLGVRIGLIGNGGTVQYGPLSYEGKVTSPLIGKYDTYAWVGVPDVGNGKTGLVRFDLSRVGEDGRAPYATDVYSPTANADSGAGVHGIWPMTQDTLYFLTQDQSAPTTLKLMGPTANLVSSGEVTSGWVRFGTLERKNVTNLNLYADGTVYGSVAVALVNGAGVTGSTLATLTSASDWDAPIASGLSTPQRKVRVKLTLTRDGTTASLGPTVDGWQLRALPSVRRQELVRVPLLCFDFERDSKGQQVGYEGWAWARYQAVKAAVDDSEVVTFQSFRTGESVSCVVEDVVFQMVSPPVTASGFGGVLTVTVRTVA